MEKKIRVLLKFLVDQSHILMVSKIFFSDGIIKHSENKNMKKIIHSVDFKVFDFAIFAQN